MVARQEFGFVLFCSRVGEDHHSKILHGNYDPTFAEAFFCSRGHALQHATGLSASLCGPSRHLDVGWK